MGRSAGLAAALLLCAATSHATATPEAQRAIDRYLAATGGRAAFEAERTLHQRGTAVGFGLTGTAESWSVRPDRQLTIAHLGPLTITQGVVGERAWRQISGTPLQWSDGKDLDADLAEAWFEAERWCAPDHGGGRVELAPRDAPRVPHGTTLRITPPRGPARIVELDAAGLVATAREKRDQLTFIYESSEYRLSAGRVRPHREEQRVVEAPANSMRIDVTFTEINVPVAESLFAPGIPHASDAAFAPGQPVVRVPLSIEQSVPRIRVAVNGHAPAWFLVDTGSTMASLDSAYAARIGVRGTGTVQVQGVGAQAAIQLADIDSLVVTDSTGSTFAVRTTHMAIANLGGDLGGASSEDGRIAGILGGDVLARAVFTLDPDASTFTLTDPAAFAPPAAADSLPFTLGSGVPIVEATLDSTGSGLFRLDTGSANGVDLHRTFTDAHDPARRAPCVVDATAEGLGGSIDLRYFRARSLRIGAATVAVPLASTNRSATGAFTSEDYAGNIGEQILRRFRATFDYTRRRLYLTPSRAFDDELRLDDGLRARPEQEGWRVLDAAPTHDGLRAGDLILDLEGDAVCVLSATQLASRLAAAMSASPLQLHVRRGASAKRLALSYPSRR